MNVDAILAALNDHDVDYILIGGMNFTLRHLPEITYDVDVWVRDTEPNLTALNKALLAIGAAWGPTDKDWKDISLDPAWLKRQSVYCLTSKFGAVDIFRDVHGLSGRFEEAFANASVLKTGTGIPFHSLSDEHMLACQEALPENQRKIQRVKHLRNRLFGEPL